MFEGPPNKTPQHFGYLMLPNFSLMAFSCAVEPLLAANILAGRPLYRWTLLSVDGQPVTASNAIAVMPQASIADENHFDAVISIGGTGAERIKDPRILGYLRRIARMGTHLGAISTAPYVLAHAGLLDNRRCTLHWENVDSFREDYPEIDVSEELFEIDGPIFTCSGGTASIDLMLHLIGAQHGHELAAAVSEWFIHKQIREQGENQRMALRFRLGVSHPKLLAAIARMEDNLETPVEREEIAESVGLSTRQLERLFSKYLNATPRKYYFSLRMQRARILLRQTSMSVLDVALACGFVSASHFAKCYRDHYGHSPRTDRGPKA
jgi:transcriptional regulator GlxA family with amidase domain